MPRPMTLPTIAHRIQDRTMATMMVTAVYPAARSAGAFIVCGKPR